MTVETTRVTPEELARTFGISIYRRAYDQGLTVSQYLEREDPTTDYPENERGLDAFERVLKAAGIVTRSVSGTGIRASTYEEATNTREKRAIIVEFFSRVWRQAKGLTPMTQLTRDLIAQGERSILLSGDSAINTIANMYTDDTTIRAKRLTPPIPLASIISRTRQIDGGDLRTLYIVDDLNTDAYRLKRVTEGAQIPMTSLVTGEHYLQIHKYGRGLRATYEQIRRQRIDRLAFIFARMALQADVDKVSDALSVIINGDGNANTSATVVALTALDSAASAGTLTLKGWLTFKARFTNVYIPDVVLAQEAAMMQLLLLPVNTVNGIPLSLMPGGDLGNLRNIGARFNQGIGYGITSDAPALKLVTFDSSVTVEEVTEIGGQISEVENFILDQTTVMTMTEIVGFGTDDQNGAKILNINA